VNCTIVTPWLNHMELAKDYWKAVAMTDADVLVIDNGSDPPLPNAHRLGFNGGFSHASNVGLELARTQAVLFLNNDIYATRSDWLDKILEQLEPGVLVGTMIRTDVHGAVDDVALPYLDGWCLAGMRDDLLELGGFDESYEEPAYYSDNDLCLRARADGMILREARAGISHKGGKTSNSNGYLLPETIRNYEKFAGRARDLMGVPA